ncbi:hypothetical protein BDV26DRAFT_293610 [Aspergillus bertholletiae]|uniref:Uncharacterized protein n=1 Tax=Aspergillus bertholletiae TaxID=1226010 RepID=A0A5N7B6N6_9EURO|nr:hypothetical protein BDV26DRAFT_293610 [Aspergillus bertholletiae]
MAGSATVTVTIIPLTTIFTPPPDCSNSWTFAPISSGSAVNGILLKNAVSVVSSCYPPGFSNTGTAMATHVFSPGHCPMGYTSADITINGPATTATCCPSNHGYYKTTVNNNGLPPAPLVGCLSSIASKEITRVPLATPGSMTDTIVSGPLTMWAQPITVVLQSTDLMLYTHASITSSAILMSIKSALLPTSTSYEDTPVLTTPTSMPLDLTPILEAIPDIPTTSVISPPSAYPTTSTDSTTPADTVVPGASGTVSEPAALSSSAKAGIGVGAAAFGLAVFCIAMVSRVFFRRKCHQKESILQTTLPLGDSTKNLKPRLTVKEVRRGPPAELEA